MKILLPFDGSPAATAAVQCVIQLAADGLDASVVLANVQEHASLYELVVAHDPQVIKQVSTAAATNILKPAQALLNSAGLAFEVAISSGDPANTLIDILEEYGCELVVMGASGTSALRSALLGSVSNELLHSADVPVLVVKHKPNDNPSEPEE